MGHGKGDDWKLVQGQDIEWKGRDGGDEDTEAATDDGGVYERCIVRLWLGGNGDGVF